MSGEGSPSSEVASDEAISPSRHRHTTIRMQSLPEPAVDRLQASGQALRRLLHAWKQLLGLTAWAQLPAITGQPPAKPSVGRRLCPALWALLFVLVVLGSIGLQWARCQQVYLDRLISSSSPHHKNDTTIEYVCMHSFVWTYLLPRLIYILGYISVFVCWFCLKHPDFIQVVAEVYDTVTDQAEYAEVSDRFCHFCRSDRRLLIGLFVLVAALSAVATLFGNGVVHTSSSFAKDSRMASIMVVAEIFGFITNIVMDNVMFFCLISYTLSLKYFDLILMKTQTHLAKVSEQAHLSSDCYVRPQYMRAHRLMTQSQACICAVILLVLLRVCQGVTLISLDLTMKAPRTESLGLLPVILAYTAALCYHIHRCCRLSADGLAHHLRHVSTGPNFATGGTPETDEVTDEAAPLQPPVSTSSEPTAAAGRSAAQWRAALDVCPAVTAPLFGATAAGWVAAVLLLVALCYCAGYYTLERYWPLV